MRIGGLVKTSFTDYPGKISAVIFTAGCNFDCWYCHNRRLLTTAEELDKAEILDFLRKRKGKLDAVVFSGGEACMQDGLCGMIAEVKSMGYLVKLDTNGSYPQALSELLDKKLLDFVAMDVKAPFGKYKTMLDIGQDITALQESVRLIMEHAPDYEFRTTCFPGIKVSHIRKIAKEIKGAKSYALQRYRHDGGNERQAAVKYTPRKKRFFDAAAKAAKKYVGNVITRGL